MEEIKYFVLKFPESYFYAFQKTENGKSIHINWSVWVIMRLFCNYNYYSISWNIFKSVLGEVYYILWETCNLAESREG